MNNKPRYNIYPCGDHAFTVSFGNIIDDAVNKHVLNLFYLLRQQNIAGLKDIIPAYSSVTIVYDVVAIRKKFPYATAYNKMAKMLEQYMHEAEGKTENMGSVVRIPVCYERRYAPDLNEIAALKNIHTETIVQLHCSKTYRVFMLGFLPGFAYMGTLDEAIEMPRKNNPRNKVAAGSVGIAGKQTGIYPCESPGGWNIIGQTPLTMFDANCNKAALLQPGDYVQFYPITKEAFEAIKTAQ